jgi:predicted transcriptional regulator
MNANVLRLLLAGEYICSVRYRDEFALLEDGAEQEEVNAWLGPLNKRLARLGEDGAFFMAHAFIGAKEIAQVKGELLRFRDEYGPAVMLLDFIRQTDAGRVTLSPGEHIALYQLEATVSQSTMLETQLKGLLGVISSSAMRNTNHENLRRLLEQLAKDGYVVLVNKDSGTYQVTGKVEQLYAVLQFLDENKVIPDAEVDDREDTGEDLVDAAQADGGLA